MWSIERNARGQPVRLWWFDGTTTAPPRITVPLRVCHRCGSGRIYDGQCKDCARHDTDSPTATS